MPHPTSFFQTRPSTDCAAPGCQYNQTIGLMDSVGYCVCQQQFCKEHFQTHRCFQDFKKIFNNLENR